SRVDNLVDDRRFLKDDLRRQGADVLRRRDRNGVFPTAQSVNRATGEINHAERWLKQETCKHACGNDDPSRPILRSQQIANLQSLVEQVVRAALSDDVVIHTELPGNIALQAGIEDRTRELELEARPGDESGATDDGVKPFEKGGQLGG